MSFTDCRIHAFYDGEAQVWVAESDDVPGLVTEAESWDTLVETLHHLVPELLSENGRDASTVRMHLTAEFTEVLPAWGPMKDYAREVRSLLLAHNCRFVRQGKGSHEIWESPATGIRFPVGRTIKSRHTANGILKQAGISKRF